MRWLAYPAMALLAACSQTAAPTPPGEVAPSVSADAPAPVGEPTPAPQAPQTPKPPPPPPKPEGKVAKATNVVGGMYDDFRRCYMTGLQENPGMAGSVTLFAEVDAEGKVTRVFNDATELGPILPCLKEVVSSRTFDPPEKGRARIAIPVDFGP